MQVALAPYHIQAPTDRSAVARFIARFGGIARCARFLLSVPTFCTHRNTHYVMPDKQFCWDCKRVRFFSSQRVASVWHREAR